MSAKLFLFGQFRWELSTGFVVPPLREKTQALIAYIALSGNGVVARHHAALLLWESGRDPNASLRQSVREIREMEEKNNSDLFSFDKKFLKLDLNRLWIDVRLASKCANEFNMGLADQLLECTLGPLMQNCSVHEEAFSDWLRTERSRRENDINFSMEYYLDYAGSHDTHSIRLKRIASALLSVDSTNEIAHRILMKTYLNEGDRASAKRQFDLCKRTIRRELGIEPSDETIALAKDVTSRSHLKSEVLLQAVEVVASPKIQANETLTKPIIQVNPFVVSTQDDVLSYFSQTFHADICEQLSRNRRFSIRDATATLISGLSVESEVVDNIQSAQYVVRGSVISISEKVTFLVQLYDGRTGDILWMTRHNLDLKESLSEADEVAIMAAVEMIRFIELQEAERINNTEDGLLDARQCVIRAVSIMFKFSSEAVARAERYLQRALLLYPKYPEALAWLAFLKSIEIGQGYTDDVQANREEIGALVRRSIELSPQDDVILAIAGHLEAFIHHDFESAQEYFERSLKANPNCAYAWGFSAITNCYIGKPGDALEMLQRCRQIMPFDPHPYYFDTARCIASMLAGKYEDAVRIGRQVLRNNPNFHANYRPLISSLGHLGRQEEAMPVVHEFEKYQPDFSVSWHLANYPPLDDDKTETYIDGLRKAGVSE